MRSWHSSALGSNDWFTYCNSPVLDGEQWSLFDGHSPHGGSNAYPKGFEKLLRYLGGEFSCAKMRPEVGETYDGPTEMEGLAMLLFIICRVSKRSTEGSTSGTLSTSPPSIASFAASCCP